MSKDKGVVAAGHELTAAAAAEILQDGGNAFDACVAGLFMTFVAEAVFASPGGGGFLMARRAGSDKITLFDFFAETPRKRRPASEIDFYPIYADFGPAKQEFHIGAGSSATPGVVPGLFAMHEELCRLPMKRLVEPAVHAARAGFPLSAFQAYLLTVIAPILKATTGVAKIFAPGGTLLKAGETFSNPDLAETIAWLAEDGAGLFLDGDVGQAIVAQQRDGGYLTHADLADYRVARRTPILWQHDGAVVGSDLLLLVLGRLRHQRVQPLRRQRGDDHEDDQQHQQHVDQGGDVHVGVRSAARSSHTHCHGEFPLYFPCLPRLARRGLDIVNPGRSAP
jgi:gamma-glutamyltranspeptidase/glutathione hydrolase